MRATTEPAWNKQPGRKSGEHVRTICSQSQQQSAMSGDSTPPLDSCCHWCHDGRKGTTCRNCRVFFCDTCRSSQFESEGTLQMRAGWCVVCPARAVIFFMFARCCHRYRRVCTCVYLHEYCMLRMCVADFTAHACPVCATNVVCHCSQCAPRVRVSLMFLTTSTHPGQSLTDRHHLMYLCCV